MRGGSSAVISPTQKPREWKARPVVLSIGGGNVLAAVPAAAAAAAGDAGSRAFGGSELILLPKKTKVGMYLKDVYYPARRYAKAALRVECVYVH